MYKIIIAILLCWCAIASAGEFISPGVVGSTDADSIIVSITVADTTVLPTIVDADSLYILRFAPNQSLLDSINIGASNLFKMRTGFYVAHYKASASGALGIYQVYAKAKIHGAWRGHVAGGYLVKTQTTTTLATKADSLFQLMQLATYALGICDGCVKVYSPNDGTEYKDGYEVWVGGQKKVTISFGHSNDASVLDTTTTVKNY